MRVRRSAGALAVDSFFRTASLLGRLHPRSRPERHGVKVTRGIAYAPDGQPEHRLDVYRSVRAQGPRPAMLYVHGGGFRILSKDTHWLMGLAFARAGYVVFNINYRLAPRHRFPAAVEDCATAYRWLCEQGPAYGADLDRVVFAGESAGANLITSLALMCCTRRDEPWARAVFDRGVVPRAWLPYCGMLQVSDPGRFRRRKPNLSTFIDDRLVEVTRAYLGRDPSVYGATLDLADPLVVFERGEHPERPLPPCFATVGTADPLLDDTRRLAAALAGLGCEHQAIYYPGEVHAFHALVWREQARRCWSDTFRFLDRHVPAGVDGVA